MDAPIPLQIGERWLDTDDRVELLRTAANHLQVSFFEVGIKLSVSNWGRYTDLKVFVPTTYAKRTQGFLGNFDGRNDNEFHTRENTIALPNLIGDANQVTDRHIFPHLDTLCK